MHKRLLKELIIGQIRRAQTYVIAMDNKFEEKGYKYDKIDEDLLLQWMRLGDRIVEEVAHSKNIEHL